MQQFARLIPIAFFAILFLNTRSVAQTLVIVPETGYDTCAPFPLTLRADSTVINGYGAFSVTLTTLDTVLSASFSIAMVDCCHPALPNAFTPNGDDVNDKFGVILKYCDVQILEFSVYSRWGELMFQAIESTDRWDGTTLNGTEAPSDVYIYVTRYKVADEEEEKSEKGNVTLLR